MIRTRASSLVLVNWKGVFYERYALDSHVTALEGANGAGKTTVMIAAYVVLLPDMSRLRFTNLGETGATGGDRGIWGRLGELGRPSYAAIDFALPGGKRLVAGVHLLRKGEPSVEPMPFVITGLEASLRLQDLMLVAMGDEDAVPELQDLQENAARLGGRLQRFNSAREYFAALFEHGVTPLRLSTDEERNKLNEMLRTSMTGGISRTLTSELRSFLLKEDTGLADTLQRMKANLSACRRTRTEVHESQKLEREIGGVYEAGNGMFIAAMASTHERAAEHRHRVKEAEAAHAQARRALEQAEAELTAVERSIEAAEQDLDATKLLLESRRTALHTLEAALTAAQDASRLREELHAARQWEREADQAREKALKELEACKRNKRAADENHRRAARGLADLQQGLEELHRRAGAFAQVNKRLGEARCMLDNAELEGTSVLGELETTRRRLEQVDGERRERGRQLDDAEAHAREFNKVLAWVSVLAGGSVSPAEGRGEAVRQLGRFRELRVLASRVGILERELNDARERASRQDDARRKALSLGVEVGAGPNQVRSLLEAQERRRTETEHALREGRERLAVEQGTSVEASERVDVLLGTVPLWKALCESAKKVANSVGAEVVDRPGLDRARLALSDHLQEAVTSEKTAVEARDAALSQARELMVAGGPFEPGLLRLRDELSAELLATQFEDIAIDQAGPLEARLGPLVNALVVDNARRAANAIMSAEGTPNSVWLLDGNALDGDALGLDHPVSGEQHVVVEDGAAVRVTKIPDKPKIGRKAREARAAELRAAAEQWAAEAQERRSRRRLFETLSKEAETLLDHRELWLSRDPAVEAEEQRRRQRAAETAARQLHKTLSEKQDVLSEAEAHAVGLRTLLGQAFLLEGLDYTKQAERLSDELSAARDASLEVERGLDAALELEDTVDVLRRLPLSEADIERLRREQSALDADRDRLFSAIDAMEYVLENEQALGWDDAAGKLAAKQQLVPSLEAQLEDAERAVASSEAAVLVAEKAWEQATSAWQSADGKRRALVERLEDAERRLTVLGIAHPSLEGVAEARGEVERLRGQQQDLDARLRALSSDRGRAENVRDQSKDQFEEAEARLLQARSEAQPAAQRWEQLEAEARDNGLLSAELAAQLTQVGRGSPNLSQEARSQQARLTERLRAATGGQSVLAEVEGPLNAPEHRLGSSCLQAWLIVRSWLRRRVPARIVEVDDPLEALMRLRDSLAGLEERLAQQESDLRGASEDVARGIDVQVRKARGQVNRLNKSLVGVQFGSIHGIRVRLKSNDRMEQVLRALREGAAQTLLFQSDISIEQALEEIFKRYGGRTGGQRLLDYREYIHLQVEIRRNGPAHWEVANPTHLSTGEAIGVGAALMMVVLTEWERDATLFRGKRAFGSLRFLFLDEANRLDHENLGTLFALCQSLELQLLIASPEVARAEGNTTYRLVRTTSALGREEVLVSGRRTVAEA